MQVPSNTTRAARSASSDPAHDAATAAVLEHALAQVHAWCPEPQAVVLGGSHASGEAVWVAFDGRSVSLSDLDLYAIVDSISSRDAARRAQRDGDRSPATALAAGLFGELEVAFFTRDEMSRLPARPATLELARHARILKGDPSVLATIPHYAASDIPFEEIALLHANRGFELLWCRPRIESSILLERLAARHALHKAALDLAGIETLRYGEYPDGAAARIARARELAGSGGEVGSKQRLVTVDRAGLEQAWRDALAWRQGSYEPWPAGVADRAWSTVARAWCDAWRELAAGSGADDIERAREDARRAPLRRRVRQAIEFAPRVGPRPAFAGRMLHALQGTPAHRLNASAAIVLLALARGPGADALSVREQSALAQLGILDAAAAREPDAASARLVRLWDCWWLDGRRTSALA